MDKSNQQIYDTAVLDVRNKFVFCLQQLQCSQAQPIVLFGLVDEQDIGPALPRIDQPEDYGAGTANATAPSADATIAQLNKQFENLNDQTQNKTQSTVPSTVQASIEETHSNTAFHCTKMNVNEFKTGQRPSE